jgi:hypothetical protein
MIIGLSLGCSHKLVDDKTRYCADDWISWHKKNQEKIGEFNAIEIYMNAETEKHFKLSKDNYDWLSQFKHISYHLTQFTDSTAKAIERFPFITCFVMHINKSFKLPEEFIKKYGHKIAIENVAYMAFYSSNEFYNMCLDVAHAWSYGNEGPNNLYKRFQKHIVMIHLSDLKPEGNHFPLYKSGEGRFRQLHFSMKNYPIIIEASFNSITEMKTELSFLKKRVYHEFN